MVDKKYIDSLAHRFPSLSRAEIEQAYYQHNQQVINNLLLKTGKTNDN